MISVEWLHLMLVLLLMKPEFEKLWAGAIGESSSLQYLVLDEMHTYDGAQGSDVSLLIRRLKAKLKIDSGRLSCVGTSATLLSGIEGSTILKRFGSCPGDR
jgi:DEAD/DEAH box helicase domain-containing protein